MKCVARERLRIDRIACPGLIARFTDAPEFIYVPAKDILIVAELKARFLMTSRVSRRTSASCAASMPSFQSTSSMPHVFSSLRLLCEP